MERRTFLSGSSSFFKLLRRTARFYYLAIPARPFPPPPFLSVVPLRLCCREPTSLVTGFPSFFSEETSRAPLIPLLTTPLFFARGAISLDSPSNPFRAPPSQESFIVGPICDGLTPHIYFLESGRTYFPNSQFVFRP